MSLRQSTSIGAGGFRVRPWQGDPGIAYLAPSPDATRPTPASIRDCTEAVASAGYRSAMTAALHPEEAHAFLLAGYEVHDRLCVLSLDLSDGIGRGPRRVGGGHRVRRARRRDRPAALRVDAAAFPRAWRLDRAGLDEALGATPRHRFRVVHAAEGVAGYAVTGRAGRHAFLQRLATHPAHQRSGVATDLVDDAVRWAGRGRCAELLVNTQVDNHRARALYERLGFRPTPTELVVLTRELP
jgi:ribosomal protein S18 acetylase RimI-like enzyme